MKEEESRAVVSHWHRQAGDSRIETGDHMRREGHMGVGLGGEVNSAQEEARKRWRALAGLAARGAAWAGVLWAIWSTGWIAAGEWQAGRGTEESLARAMRFDRRNGAHVAARARLLQSSMQGGSAGEAVRLWEEAVALNPRRAEWWVELGGAYEWSGRSEEALQALQNAKGLFPRGTEVNWKLGNFYLRSERHVQAQQALREVVQDDPAMRRGVFDLAWRAGYEEETILDAIVGDEPGARIAYLDFLVETKRVQAAKRVWGRLLEQGLRVPQREAFSYLDALIQEGEAEELRGAWSAVEGEQEDRPPTRDGESEITNGSFEQRIMNGGCDWRVLPAEGVFVSLDAAERFDGARALRVEFDGKSNLAYSHVLQFVPVRQNTRYRLSAYLRTREMTSNSGPRLEVYDNASRERLFVSTEDILGTTGWVPWTVEFQTGSETRIVAVRLARPASNSLDGRIRGTVWIDQVSLRAVE